MTKNGLSLLMSLALTTTVAACGVDAPDATPVAVSAAKSAPDATGTPASPAPAPASPAPAATPCPDPSAPRASAAPIPGPSVQAGLDAWTAALDDYSATIGAYNAEAAAHAEAYAAASTGIVAAACLTDADCDTHSSAFPGRCRLPYYGQAQCEVLDANPLPGAPATPAAPVFTCADYSCPGDFQCEVEIETGSVTCLAPRPKCGAAPSSGHGGRP